MKEIATFEEWYRDTFRSLRVNAEGYTCVPIVSTELLSQIGSDEDLEIFIDQLRKEWQSIKTP